jgi:hypothetical protein
MGGSSDTIRGLLACGMWGTRAGWARDRHAIRRPRSKLPTPRYGALGSLAWLPEVLGGVGGDPRRRHEERLAPAAHAAVRRCASGRWSKEVRGWVALDPDLDPSGRSARHNHGQEATEHRRAEGVAPPCADRAGTLPNTRTEKRSGAFGALSQPRESGGPDERRRDAFRARLHALRSRDP